MLRTAAIALLTCAAGLAACATDDLDPADDSAEGPLTFRFRAPTVRHGDHGRALPPLSGGTLAVLRDGRTVMASDPDHDAVWVADLTSDAPARRVALQAHDEPGRLVEDDAGAVHVVLRGGGAVATLDPGRAAVTARRDVCPAPRGVAWDAGARVLRVACAGGELVALPPSGAVASVAQVGGELRDVAVVGGAVFVSRFRSAAVLRVEGDVATPVAMGDPSTENTAWRLLAAGSRLVTLSQSVRTFSLGATPSTAGYYGNVATSTIPMMPHVRVGEAGLEPALDALVADGGLTVDVAAAEDNGTWRFAVASPGWAFGQGFAQVREWTSAPWTGQRLLRGAEGARALQLPGQAVAVAYTPSRALVVQTRSPGRIITPTHTIVLYDDDVAEAGHDVFHAATNSGLACASCHPEGGDDGVTWRFAEGLRRTPSLRGGILQTAPFHWSGDLRDMAALGARVFTSRMGGGTITPSLAQSMGRWIDTLPALPRRAVDGGAAARGEGIFRSAEAGCAGCHSGAMLTNNASVAVGTGGIFQVPPLVGLAWRAPYMHDGCAPTLADRFRDARCGGGEQHGRTAHLGESGVRDLVAYLESL